MFSISSLRIHKDKSFHCDVCNVCLDKRLEGKHKCRPDSGHDECCICLEVTDHCIVTFPPQETYFSDICNSHLPSSLFLVECYPGFSAIENLCFHVIKHLHVFMFFTILCHRQFTFSRPKKSSFSYHRKSAFFCHGDSCFPVNCFFCHTQLTPSHLTSRVRTWSQHTFVFPRHAMPCHAMPCHAMPCHAMHTASHCTLMADSVQWLSQSGYSIYTIEEFC